MKNLKTFNNLSSIFTVITKVFTGCITSFRRTGFSFIQASYVSGQVFFKSKIKLSCTDILLHSEPFESIFCTIFLTPSSGASCKFLLLFFVGLNGLLKQELKSNTVQKCVRNVFYIILLLFICCYIYMSMLINFIK